MSDDDAANPAGEDDRRASVVIELPPREGGARRTVHIIGTAHVSRKSIEEVQRVIRQVEPDTVCVELDQLRYEALTDETRWRKLDIFKVVRDQKALFTMASLALQAYQRRLGERLGVRPGAELLAGVEAAKEVGAEVVLADRDVQATLRRTWANLGGVSKAKLFAALSVSVFDSEEIDEAQVEALKDREHISDMMSELARAMPEVKVPLIDERDQYLMTMIERAPGQTLVAVVGAGHVEGMVKQVGKPADLEALSKVPPRSLLGAVLKWVVPTLVLASFAYGYFAQAGAPLADMLLAWVLPHVVLAGLATAIGGGKLLSILTSMVASPIVSLQAMIGSGVVVGLVEARLRTPTKDDCEQLGREVTTWAGMRKNPFSRILIVTIASNIGSRLSSYVGLGWVLTCL